MHVDQHETCGLAIKSTSPRAHIIMPTDTKRLPVPEESTPPIAFSKNTEETENVLVNIVDTTIFVNMCFDEKKTSGYETSRST